MRRWVLLLGSFALIVTSFFADDVLTTKQDIAFGAGIVLLWMAIAVREH